MPAQLRFSDVDRFGHVNNSVYFSLFDMCKTRYLFDVVGKDIFEKVSIVVVHVDADFISPVYFPDEIVIETAIKKLGHKSFTLHQRALNKRTNDVKCECETVMVVMDNELQQSVDIPEDFRRMVAAFEGNENLAKQ
ncbi:MAG: acyl-CoA thioesterase [Prevotella sp.]|nr:acyl-CoA thioesterase [Prevotella sp.]